MFLLTVLGTALKAIFSATWKNHKAKFSDLVEGMKEHRYIIIGNTSMAEYRNNRRHREQMAIEKRLEKDEQVFQQLRSWLESADVENDHHRLRKAQTPGTGRWLFDHPLFKRWFDPKSPYVPLLLWLNGKPGAGKSVLSSMIVEEAKENARKQSPQPAVLYFYCKNEVEEKDNFSAIGRSLLLQLLEPDSPILDHLHSAFRNNKTKDTILRTRHMIEDLLEAALLSCPSAYIILDGIDECQLEERQPIIAWFKTFVTQKLPKGCEAQVRVLFVSQDDMRARRDFSGITSLAIKVEDNKGDMELFAQGKAIEIQQKFSTSVEIRSIIATKVPQSSDGE
jgi:Cdc6-like AAA superfamily ATPase